MESLTLFTLALYLKEYTSVTSTLEFPVPVTALLPKTISPVIVPPASGKKAPEPPIKFAAVTVPAKVALPSFKIDNLSVPLIWNNKPSAVLFGLAFIIKD